MGAKSGFVQFRPVRHLPEEFAQQHLQDIIFHHFSLFSFFLTFQFNGNIQPVVVHRSLLQRLASFPPCMERSPHPVPPGQECAMVIHPSLL